MRLIKNPFLPSAILLASLTMAQAQTTFTLDPLTSFGIRGDGSIQPGDSIGTNPQSGNNVLISASGGYGIQPGDLAGGTNGFNMRGIAYDSISGNLVFVDTHEGSGGSANMVPNAAIYILDPNSGQIVGALNTNGIVGGGYTHVPVGVADDGVVYVCNQTLTSTSPGFKIYRWPSATNYSAPPVVAFTNDLSPSDRLGETMDVRGAGTNTQIAVGSAVNSGGGGGTNIYLFTTTDGTNFSPHRIYFPGITTAMFGDGIVFGPGNTFFAKQVGQPLSFLAYDPVAYTGSIIAQYSASSLSGTDPLLNLAGITVDLPDGLMGAIEEISGTASGGPGKVWLFAIPNPTNQAPAILSSRTYIPNFTKATATMGYLHFGGGQLYANVVNNGLLASKVDSISMPLPTFILPADYPGGPVKATDLPATNRAAIGTTAHFEVFATPDVTNYQWYSNNVPVPGANTYFLNVPNVQSANSGDVYYVTAANAAGPTTSMHCTLTVISGANFFHPSLLWSFVGGATNYITSTGGSSTPNERCIAYHGLSNQLLVVRGPATFSSLRIFVVNADNGSNQYLLSTNGMTSSTLLCLCGIGVADDGVVYASSVAADATFKVWRWANTASNTVPQLIFGTNSSATQANPIADEVGSLFYRFGDNLAVHGSGTSTEIILDSQTPTKYAGILRPTDGTMTNWSQTGYLLQNISGSYGFQAYGASIGRSLQFGPVLNGPGGSLPTFWQKRYQLGGAPLAAMGYNPGGGVSPLDIANVGIPLFTNGPMDINFTLNVAAAVNFAGVVANNLTLPDTLDYYDMTDPSQAVLLSRQNLPGANAGGHMANANAVAQVIFGQNVVTGTNYLFAIDGNNGISGYALTGGVTPAPKVLIQPSSLRVLQDNSNALGIAIDQTATIQWFKGTNPPVSTGIFGTSYPIASAQLTNSGSYFAVATNLNGSVTSQVVQVTVESPADNYTLTELWQAKAGNAAFPYVTATGGANTPNERSFAYNALSNQLLVVSCPVSTHNYNVYVVDAPTGSNLYTLNATGIVNEGSSEVSGSNPLDLDSIVVADDGAVYIASLTPNASGGQFGDPTKMLHVFRWADSGSNTAPTLVYEGDPSDQPAGINERWGDVMAARGSGTNTELILNSYDGAYGALLKPTDSTMSQFTNFWFSDTGGAGSIGRSIQFGATNTVYEKRKGAATFYSLYNTNTGGSSIVGAINSTSTLGGVYVSAGLSLAAGVDYVGSTTAPLKPDAVALYDISDPTAPLFLQHVNFPTNEVANANYISQTIISGLRVYSLDGNNGLVSFVLNPPVNSLTLTITSQGANVMLSWGSSEAVLQSSPSLDAPVWSDLTTVGQTNSIQPASANVSYYRLVVRR
ncbi:MAG TPA: hypothetical protein VFC44_03465 [Candidatus Saccharimonadales bacterium]|nr:hypothetical protein [Candidatus Saccharimonadales bacterium]